MPQNNLTLKELYIISGRNPNVASRIYAHYYNENLSPDYFRRTWRDLHLLSNGTSFAVETMTIHTPLLSSKVTSQVFDAVNSHFKGDTSLVKKVLSVSSEKFDKLSGKSKRVKGYRREIVDPPVKYTSTRAKKSRQRKDHKITSYTSNN